MGNGGCVPVPAGLLDESAGDIEIAVAGDQD
ncbi:Uncharacterised protein [Mycobacterium tuberculosis]|nr:Uncharacterised protein [Mycobacterium tuberculosis]